VGFERSFDRLVNEPASELMITPKHSAEL